MITLVVTNPFDGRKVGDRITDEEQVKAILAGGHAHHVVQSEHKIALANTPRLNTKKES